MLECDGRPDGPGRLGGFQRALKLDPEVVALGPGCTSESLGSCFVLFLSAVQRLHPRLIKSKSLEVGPRHQ